MATNISPDDYCAHPEDYKNSPEIDEDTRQLWDAYCKLKKQAGSSKVPSGQDWKDNMSDAVCQMILSMMTPPGIVIMGGIVGGPIMYKAVKSWIGQIIKDGLSKEAIEVAEKFIEKGGTKYIANSCMLADDFIRNAAYATVDVAEEAGYEGGRLAVAYLFKSAEMLAELVDVVGIVMMLLQMVGMVFDAWDPCNLDVQLDAEQLAIYTHQFDSVFRSTVLSSVGSSADSYGQVTTPGNWPIEYYAEDTALRNLKKEYYDPLQLQLTLEYVDSLEFNSDGLPISRGVDAPSLISKEHLSNIESQLLTAIGGGNTVVENWLYRWWPLVLGIAILLVVILFLIRKK